jgi:hypothetical protein
MKHMTSSWLRKYANVMKHASYQDKLDSVYSERNPYYLLEWFVFPISGEEADMIRFSRSPSMIKNSYLDFNEVFFDQIIYEIAFKAYSSAHTDEWLLNTAIRDLQTFYGHDVWEKAVHSRFEEIQIMWTKVELFEQQLKQEEDLISKKYRDQIREIKEIFEDDSEEQKFQLMNARDLHEQRMVEAPRKLLQKKFKPWPLAAYVHYNKPTQPRNQLEWLMEHFLKAEEHALFEFVKNGDFNGVLERIRIDEGLNKHFKQWFPAYASKSLMNVEHINIVNRQNWWIGMLQYLNEYEIIDDKASDLCEITFELQGIDEVMMQDSLVPGYFNYLVSIALKTNERRRWLRENIILRYWPVFIRSFVEEEYEYKALSWVLCMDPESLEQRLIRGLQQSRDSSLSHADLSFIIDRVTQIFTDAIRSGLDSELMVPLFKYLTIHHIDFIYSYIQRIKQAEQFFPILSMDSSFIQRVFGGKGVRAHAARKSLQPIFLVWLEQMDHSDQDQKRLQHWSEIYLTDKGELLQLWLDQIEKNKNKWPYIQAAKLEEMLQFKWLGQPDSADHEHEQVKAWLVQHSDWIKFDLDTQASHREGVKYRILRPGYKDLLTDQVLARVRVRAEVTDQKEISSLLDDLKNL